MGTIEKYVISCAIIIFSTAFHSRKDRIQSNYIIYIAMQTFTYGMLNYIYFISCDDRV